MNEEQKSEFSRLLELSKQQTESLLADSKKQLADSKKQLLAAQSLGVLIGKFAEKAKRRKQFEKQNGSIEFTLLEMLVFLKGHRN